MTIVAITNLDRVERIVSGLGKREEKVLAKNNKQFIGNIQRSAKLMAPRDTGELAASIKRKATKTKGKVQQYLLAVEAPHAGFQEDGFEPHFAFIRNSSKLSPGIYSVQKNTPCVKPAIEKNFSRVPQSLNNGIRRVMTL